MATGRPRLATWGNDFLRLYELTDIGFVLIGSANLLWTGDVPQYPYIYWPHDSEYLGVALEHPQGVRLLKNYSLIDLSELATDSRTFSSSTTHLTWAFNAIADHIVHVGRTTSSFYNVQKQNPGGTVIGGITNNYLTATNSAFPLKLKFSPDGEYVVRYRIDAGLIDIYYKNPSKNFSDADISDMYGSSVHTLDFGATRIPDVEFFFDSQKVLIANANKVDVYDTAFSPSLAEVTTGLDSVEVVRIHPNNEIVACSGQVGGVWTTEIYRYFNSAFTLLQTISGLGQLLDFTAGGLHLIDSGLQKAYAWNGTVIADCFTDDSGIMANVVAGALSQGLSTHALDTVTRPSSFYNTAAAGILTRTIDLDNLYVTFLSSAATFDPTHTTLDQVTGNGADEITTGGWPAGGHPLGARINTELEDSGTISYEDKTIPITGDDYTFRCGVVYDKTTNRPVLFVRYASDVTVPAGQALIFGPDGSLIEAVDSA